MKQHDADAGKFWKISIIAIIGIFIVATAASLVAAKRKVSKVVDVEYYSHGLRYAETRRSANAGAGWTMTASVSGGDLQVLVRDGAGLPVTGGLMVYNFDHATGHRSASLDLNELSPGMYRAARPGDAQGDFRGTMRFTKGGATIVGKLVVIN